MDIAKIKTLLASDHPVSGAWNEDDALAADQFNAANITHVSPVAMRWVVRWAGRHDIFTVLGAGSSSGNKDIRKLCKAALVMVNNPRIPDFDVADPELNEMFQALVTGEIVTQDQKDDLFAMGVSMISLATQEGLATVNATHIAHARAYHVE